MTEFDWTEVLALVDEEIDPDIMGLDSAIEAIDELIGSLRVRLDAMRQDVRNRNESESADDEDEDEDEEE